MSAAVPFARMLLHPALASAMMARSVRSRYTKVRLISMCHAAEVTWKSCRRPTTTLQRAIRTGRVPKARRSYAMYLQHRLQAWVGQATQRHKVGAIAADWRNWADGVKNEWRRRSQEEFRTQRAASLSHGLKHDVMLRDEAVMADAVGMATLGTIPVLTEPASPVKKPPAVSVPTDGMRVGPYQLHNNVGAGSYGTVFKATHVPSGRYVAAKLFSIDGSGHDDYVNEVRVVAAILSVRCISEFARSLFPHYLAHYKHDSFQLLVTQFVQGGALRQFARQGPLPTLDALAIIMQAQQAVGAMHAVVFVHMDVSTHNFLWNPDQRHLTLIDFSMSEKSRAKDFRHDMYTTEPYRAPEVFNAARASMVQLLVPATDVWAVGCCIFEVVAGRRLLGNHGWRYAVRRWCYSVLNKQTATIGQLLDGAGEWSPLVAQLCNPVPGSRPVLVSD